MKKGDIMEKDYRQKSYEYWDDVYQRYNNTTESIKTDDWLDRFAELIAESKEPVLDLGCGGGNNTKYLLGKGKQVIACDQSKTAIADIRRNFPELTEAKCFNMLDGLQFADASFSVVIADLCLHYFTEKDTEYLLGEIRRILKPGGHLMLRVNSMNDVNHGAGKGIEIEHHVYETERGTLKRFFDEEDIKKIFGSFEIEYAKEEIMSRYSLEKRLFRVCLRK